MCDKRKEYINKLRGKQDTISCKINCPFDIITTLEEQIWSYQVQNENHNHSPILTRVYPIYRKIA